MSQRKRVFVFGAGFSKPAGMPLATELLPLLAEKLELDDMRDWIDGLRDRLAWLSGHAPSTSPFALNIEQVFHYAQFDVEVHRLKQHLVPVGRRDGPETPWNHAESIKGWLSFLEEALQDVILEKQERADLSPIAQWAEHIDPSDAVLTFNYDTLAERALTSHGCAWHHGTRHGSEGIPVFKLHGSIDWIVAHRSESFVKLELLFDKENANQSKQNTGHVEDDCRLWRCRSESQLREWIEGRDLQSLPAQASARTVGIAGLGAYKQLHQIPGLGRVWARGMRTLYEADVAIIVGFSMSEFDAFAQMQFAEVAKHRSSDGRPLPVIVIDPFITETSAERYRRVFRTVEFLKTPHELVNWDSL